MHHPSSPRRTPTRRRFSLASLLSWKNESETWRTFFAETIGLLQQEEKIACVVDSAADDLPTIFSFPCCWLLMPLLMLSCATMPSCTKARSYTFIY